MRKNKPKGFDYHLSDEAIRGYMEKPLELRLKWLYMGNLLRMGYGKRLRRIQGYKRH